MRTPVILAGSLFIASACAGSAGQPRTRPLTYEQLAVRCTMSTTALDSLLLSSARRLQRTRDIDMHPTVLAAILATSLPRREVSPNCAAHADLIVRTVLQ